ncbi:MAG: hypothetical protein JWO91_3899 [Acidobacteriaceae bacterium]|jgi:hypothetical protein|nr:hypothetical protein [Acidobacteriaceae bacterium]
MWFCTIERFPRRAPAHEQHFHFDRIPRVTSESQLALKNSQLLKQSEQLNEANKSLRELTARNAFMSTPIAGSQVACS